MRTRRELDGWSSRQGRADDGSIDSDERVHAPVPVVEHSEAGALALGDRYWRAIAGASRGLVRWRAADGGIELRLLGVGPAVLRFGRPESLVDDDGVHCRFPIRGGLLARRPGGSITLSQTDGEPPELRAIVKGFVPRLARTPFYDQLQRRIHVRVSRTYFRDLLCDARR